MTIERIIHPVHSDEVLLITAAIDATPNNVARPKSASAKTYDMRCRIPWSWSIEHAFVGFGYLDFWHGAHVFFLLICCLGLNLRVEGPIKGSP